MARRKKEEAPGDPNAWMVTFSDLLTLLLTFFVMLLIMSSMDSSKLEEAFEAFLPTGGLGATDGPPQIFEDEPSNQLNVIQREMMQKIALVVRTTGSDLFSLNLGGNDLGNPPEGDGGDGRPTTDQGQGGRPGGPDIEDEGLEVFVDERGLVVRLPSSLAFDSGSADLKPIARQILEPVGKMMTEDDLEGVVEGHTDDQPISTLRFPSNWDLSMARAASVVRFLIGEAAVDPKRLAASGYADRRPLASNKTPTGRQKNRRVEIVLTMPKGASEDTPGKKPKEMGV